jgi:hypothetical protein
VLPFEHIMMEQWLLAFLFSYPKTAPMALALPFQNGRFVSYAKTASMA